MQGRSWLRGRAWLLVASIAAAASACGLISGIDKLEFVPDCTTNADCDDHDACTIDTCVADGGTCAHASAPKGTPCATDDGQVCDGEGRCVACVVDGDCPGAGECQRPSCGADHACGFVFTAAGTATAMQLPGDCHTRRCDGAGHVVNAVDDADLPGDGNDCTADACKNGAPGHTQLPPGTKCGDGTIACDTSGKCAGCASDAQCTPPQTCSGGGMTASCGCTPKTCASLGKHCGSWPDGCGGTLTCDNQQIDPDEADVDCGGGICPGCAQAKKCTSPGDCAAGLFCADGVCCDTKCDTPCMTCALAGQVGTCTPIPLEQPDTKPLCASPKACNGAGQCLTARGKTCTADTACTTGFCTDGVCCETRCQDPQDACRACNLPGMAGTCGFVAQGSTDGTCGGTNLCDGQGHCKLGTGQPCTTDANCALGACNVTCKYPLGHACSTSTECASNACNTTTMTCKLPNGAACLAGTDCGSQHCKSSVCCNVGCAGSCRSCTLAGAVGTCTFLPAGTADPTCASGVCAANGVCM